MNIYAVYSNPDQDDTHFISVNEGFSFVAAMLNLFWAFYYKMWKIVFIALLINILVFILQTNNIAMGIIPIIHFVTIVIFGLFSTELREYDLQQKGYQLKDIVLASSRLEAEIKFHTRKSLITVK